MKETKSKKEVPAKEKEAMLGTVAETGNEMGTIKIHGNVIVSVIRKVTLSVDGVARLAGSTLVDNIAELVGSRKIHDRAISIDMEDDSIKVEIKVNIVHGSHIPTVANNIQKSIIQEVKKSTGKKVSSVDVIIQEVEEVEKEAPADKTEEAE